MDIIEYIKQMQEMYGDDVNMGNTQAYGGRIGFKKGERADLELENITHIKLIQILELNIKL